VSPNFADEADSVGTEPGSDAPPGAESVIVADDGTIASGEADSEQGAEFACDA
jgi:hypothetical protein